MRTISVLPVVAKLIERLVLNRIVDTLYNNNNGLISLDQLGFRPAASTYDQIARLLAIMEKALNREKARRSANIAPQNQ